MGLISTIIVGVIAGWLAGRILRGGGFGFLVNLGLGLVGAFIGGVLLPLIGLRAFGLVGNILSATAGSVVVLLLMDRLRK